MPPSVELAEITVADPPEAWAAAGFAVEADGTTKVGSVRLHLVGRDRGKRIVSWGLSGDARGDDIDGLATTWTGARPSPGAGPSHANGVTAIDHIVLVTPDTARTTAALEAVGLEVRRVRHTDQYGPPFLQTFFRAGEVIVELIGPEEPSGDGPAAFFGLAFTVADLDATAAALGDGLGAVKDAVQPGRRIATLRHKEFGMSVATAFMSPEPK